jgi:hypothetical protein
MGSAKLEMQNDVLTVLIVFGYLMAMNGLFTTTSTG